MSWKKSDIGAPAIASAAAAAGSVLGAIGAATAATAIAASQVATANQAFQDKADKTLAAFNAVVTSVENLINDTFGTGVYMLQINQFDVPGRRPLDDFGVPLLYPREALQMAISSFDDLADDQRPQFSDQAQVAAFGFLATAADIEGLKQLITQLLAVFDLSDWRIALKKYNDATVPPTVPSVYPDWKSIRLNSIPQLAGTQKALNKALENVRGTVNSAGSASKDLANMVDKKARDAKQLVQAIQDNIQHLQNAIKASGIYFLNVPVGVGGNTRLKNEIFDCNLVIQNTGYTIVGILVGGGPSAAPIEAVRGLLT